MALKWATRKMADLKGQWPVQSLLKAGTGGVTASKWATRKMADLKGQWPVNLTL
jgi:hypothetical protein